jgi:hypothetical protein
MDLYEYHGRGRVFLYWGDRDGRDVQKGMNGPGRGCAVLLLLLGVLVVVVSGRLMTSVRS